MSFTATAACTSDNPVVASVVIQPFELGGVVDAAVAKLPLKGVCQDGKYSGITASYPGGEASKNLWIVASVENAGHSVQLKAVELAMTYAGDGLLHDRPA